MKRALILANGNPPLKSQINYFKKIGYNRFICADGGANSARKLGIIPDAIIGDMDSISEENIKFFSDKCDIIKIKRQNDTDVEKVLKYLIKKKIDRVILLGATGDRLDHSICNLGIVLKYYDRINISILHAKSFLKPVSNKITFQTIRGETISLYGFNSKTKITSNGLNYPLKNVTLPFGLKESTSNVAKSNNVTLRVSGGIIFVIRDFNLMKKNDLI